MSNEAKAIAYRVAKSDGEAEEIVAVVNAELAPLFAKVERLEQALRKIEHPAHLLNEFMPNCAGCIARAALNDEEKQYGLG